MCLAARAATQGKGLPGEAWTGPLRRLQSGRVGDCVAWLLAGAARLGVLVLPGAIAG